MLYRTIALSYSNTHAVLESDKRVHCIRYITLTLFKHTAFSAGKQLRSSTAATERDSRV